MSVYLTIAVFLAIVWFSSEVNAEPVVEDRAFARERQRDGIVE